MQVRSDQLKNHLEKSFVNCYLVSGDEPFLHQQACEDIRLKAKSLGFSERVVHDVENNFDWSSMLGDLNSLSLFSERKVIELRCKKSSFDKKGSAAVISILDSLSELQDICLLISMPKLSAANKKSAWFKAVDKAGVYMQIWPLNPPEMSRYLSHFAQQRSLTLDTEAVVYLRDKNQGNLFAACQEIEKLALQFPPGSNVSCNDLENILSQNSHFNIFDLSHSFLIRDRQSASAQLSSLKEEGEEPTLILWALLRDLRLVTRGLIHTEQGQPIQSFLKQQYMPEKQKSAITQAVAKTNLSRAKRLFKAGLDIELAIKGLSSRNAWQLLERFLLQ